MVVSATCSSVMDGSDTLRQSVTAVSTCGRQDGTFGYIEFCSLFFCLEFNELTYAAFCLLVRYRSLHPSKPMYGASVSIIKRSSGCYLFDDDHGVSNRSKKG